MATRIEQWCFQAELWDGYTAPELLRYRLVGTTYGHPTRADGKRTATSAIVGVDGEMVVTQSGNRYELGEPDPTYEARFPGAKARLLKRIAEVTVPA